MTKAKSYVISKHVVWEAYKRVKANRGAAGVDGQSLAEFEKDLKGNLYKLWNRMSSGSGPVMNFVSGELRFRLGSLLAFGRGTGWRSGSRPASSA